MPVIRKLFPRAGKKLMNRAKRSKGEWAVKRDGKKLKGKEDRRAISSLIFSRVRFFQQLSPLCHLGWGHHTTHWVFPRHEAFFKKVFVNLSDLEISPYSVQRILLYSSTS
jgi:hypothetical protein